MDVTNVMASAISLTLFGSKRHTVLFFQKELWDAGRATASGELGILDKLDPLYVVRNVGRWASRKSMLYSNVSVKG